MPSIFYQTAASLLTDPWTRANGTTPFDITGLTNGVEYRFDDGQSVFLRTPTASVNILTESVSQFDNAAEWNTASGISVTGGELVYSGTQAQFANADLATSSRPTVIESTNYRIRIEATSVTTGGDFKFVKFFYNSAGDFIGSATADATVSAAGLYGFYTFTTDPLTAKLGIRIQSRTSGVQVAFDNLVVEEV